ncbi:MAG: GGDEF domain-containing protein, partial [Candidatus Gastranaerophilales bacterium]|nr:GGDEF domain-containing protein [Candidatus Gastranaerophilales bacterium]
MIRFELELLEKIEKILSQKNTATELFDSLRETFKQELKANSFELFFYDELTEDLRKFSAGWMFSYDKNNDDYKNFLKLTPSNFIFNELLLEFHKSNRGLIKLLSRVIKEETNILYIPILQSGKVAGMVKFNFVKFSPAFLKTEIMLSLKIAVTMISQSVSNFLLNERMNTNINFYNSMKNIAKVIETQYETSYIIPVIGEILDRFAPEHLIYIFAFDKEENKILWPSNYISGRLDGILEQVKKKKKTVLSDDKHTMAFPIITEDGIFGAIVADSTYCSMSEKLSGYLEQLVYQSSITLDKANTYAEILKHATTDALTNLYNRGQFDKRIRQEVATAKRNKTPLCAMMVDVDFFKKVNDTYGHAVGDTVLKGLSGIIIEQIRENDTACRYGGEEFIVILPFTQIEEAQIVADRLSSAVEVSPFDISGFGVKNQSELDVTTSIGLAQYKPSESIQEF